MINLELRSSRWGLSRSYLFSLVLGVVLLSSCGSQPSQPQTLGDIDVETKKIKQKKNAKQVTRSKQEIQQAYYDYLKDAAEDDEFRVLAATRIAEIQLEGGGAEILQGDAAKTERQYDESVRSTIIMLEDTLKDFPNAEGNDHRLYQLAKAYGQVGQSDKADATLKHLVSRYPHTPYYVEAKFRVAENAFINQDYNIAEQAYSEVLKKGSNKDLIEKSLFKRGWSRFKQENYYAALKDYYDAIAQHGFAPYETLNKSEQELYNEYFRAVGLAFAYNGGAAAVEDYFALRPSTPFAYRTYSEVSSLLLKQERYSDAVEVLQSYVNRFPNQASVVDAQLAKLDIWKKAEFFNRFVADFNDLFAQYNPSAPIWGRTHTIPGSKKQLLDDVLRKNSALLAGYYHNRYNKQNKVSDRDLALRWYEKYLNSYRAFAKQDQIYPLYAELLNKSGRYSEAFSYFELAAWDGDIVLDKESAYATIYLSDRLYQQANASSQPALKSDFLAKHLDYAFLYGQLYPTEAHTPEIIQHAVELAFKEQQLQRAIDIADILPDHSTSDTRLRVGLLKAQAYFDLKQYEEAEVLYQDLLVSSGINKKQRSEIADKLALSIYKQAETLNQQPLLAAQQYLRVQKLVPQSELAPTAVYDAIAVFMNQQRWEDAITYLSLFKKTYPDHPFNKEVGKKLSVAYLQADRSLDAAREFEQLASLMENEEEKKAALWQAGELYLKKNEYHSALRTFRDYANTYPKPYATNMEAMQHVADLYQRMGDKQKREFWLNKIVSSDKKAVKSAKTDRTQFIASNASFNLASLEFDEFMQIRLVHPLAKTLKQKKQTMQTAVKLYGQATVYGLEDFVTQSTFQIGKIYRSFAKSLLESERPRNLNEEELIEYDILLEDQAFPFEDKAIEFYETNTARIPGGTFDEWIEKSLNELKDLFPARYARTGKVEVFVEQMP